MCDNAERAQPPAGNSPGVFAFMDQATIDLLDDVNERDVLEVHYLTPEGQGRTAIGSFMGYRRLASSWWLRLEGRPSIPTIDIQRIQVLTKAGRPQ